MLIYSIKKKTMHKAEQNEYIIKKKFTMQYCESWNDAERIMHDQTPTKRKSLKNIKK